MPIPIVPIVIAGLAAAAYRTQQNQTKGIMTVERKVVFETALDHLKDPAKLRQLADEFEKQELMPQAIILRKRAAVRDLPREQQLARRQVYRKAMASTDATKVKAVADAFRSEGCTGAANSLERYANGLNAAFAGEKANG